MQQHLVNGINLSMRTVRPFNIHHAFITAEAIQPVLAPARCEDCPPPLSFSPFAAVRPSFPRRPSLAIEFARGD